MKKFSSIFLVMALLSVLLVGTSFSASAANWPANAITSPSANALYGTPTLDGNLTDWNNATAYSFNQLIKGEQLNSGWFKLMWDETAIYLAAEIPAETNDQALFSLLFDLDGLATGGDAAVKFSEERNAGIYSFVSDPWMPGGMGGPNGGAPVPWEGLTQGMPHAGMAVLGNPTTACHMGVSYDAENKKWILESRWAPTTELLGVLKENAEIGFDFRYFANWGSTQSPASGWAASEEYWNTDLRNIGRVTLRKTEETSKSAVAVNGSPVMNTDLSDWADIPSYPLSNVLSGDETDTAGWFKLMWDEEALYLGAEIPAETSDQALFSMLFDFDGLATGNGAVTFSEERDAGIYSFVSDPWMPGGMGGSHGGSPQAWDGVSQRLTEAGVAVLGNTDVACYMGVKYADGKWILETKWALAPEQLDVLKENNEIGFDFRYFANWADSRVPYGWASSNNPWGCDLRDIGKVTLGGPLEVVPLDATENNPGMNEDNMEVYSDSVNVSWNTVQGAQSYRVNVFSVSSENGEPVYTFLTSDEGVIGSSSYIAGLDANTEYALQVVAYGSSAERLAVYDLVTIKTKSDDVSSEESEEESSEVSEEESTEESEDASVEESEETSEETSDNGTDTSNPDTGSLVPAGIFMVALMAGAGIFAFRPQKG